MSQHITLVVHGHFYQPPRENPWSDEIEREPSAGPSHDWNARINGECYRANAFARVHDGAGRIADVVNNYERMSFDFGPTLARWIARADRRTWARLRAADAQQARRLGAGGGMAQAYAHAILPLASPADRRTQILWGMADFRRTFGRAAEGIWLPETAASDATLAALIDAGIRTTILAPEQVSAVRAPGKDWHTVDRDSVETGRLYRWLHPDGSGRFLTVALFDGPLSRAVAFGGASHDAAAFMAAVHNAAARSRAGRAPLVLCASDGELFGHHRKFADLTLAFAAFVEAPKSGIEISNLDAFGRAHPPTWELELRPGPDGEGTAWSCDHGVGRWRRDCGCTMAPAEWGWNQRWRGPLRAALDLLNESAADLYQDAGAALLVDPWAARDAYGEVVDAPLAERDALLATFGTPALAAGGDRARGRARLLLELQRATLLMYASCGWYFDDVAGLEAALVLRTAAYATDLMKQAGRAAPLARILEILGEARSNRLEQGTGADVFRRVAADRIAPARVAAAVALQAIAAAAPRAGGSRVTATEHAGHQVEVAWRPSSGGSSGSDRLAGTARVTNLRTGLSTNCRIEVRVDRQYGFECVVDGELLRPEMLGIEARSQLLPLLLPRLVAEGDPLTAAPAALLLGRDLIDAASGAQEPAVREGYARLLIRLLDSGGRLAAPLVQTAVALVEAAGAALAPGTEARHLCQDLLADRLREPRERARLAPLADRLGFGAAGDATAGDGFASEEAAVAVPLAAASSPAARS